MFAPSRPRRNPGFGRPRKPKGERARLGNVFVETYIALRDVYMRAAQMTELPEARVVIGWELVRTIGQNINTLQIQRRKLGDLDEAALAAFDADLAGLRQRYMTYYKPIFERLVTVHPIDWTEQDWAQYEDYVEGPVIVWNIEQCRAAPHWDPQVPRCEGPDLLTSFSLVNQAFAARDVQIRMGTSILSRVGAVVEAMAETVEEGMTEAVVGLVEITERGLQAVEEAATAGVKAAGRAVGRHLWVIPVGIIGVLWLRRRRAKRG